MEKEAEEIKEEGEEAEGDDCSAGENGKWWRRNVDRDTGGSETAADPVLYMYTHVQE